MRAVDEAGHLFVVEIPNATTMTYTANRVLVGHCPNPDCGAGEAPWSGGPGRPLVVFNDGGSWPIVGCLCGWSGPTTELVNRYRLDAGWLVSDGDGPERELRP